MRYLQNPFVALVSWLFLFPCTLPAHAVPVDHIVAAVNTEVITASELAQAVALNERTGGARNISHEALEAETLKGLITRRLLVQEARRLRFVEISDQDVDAEVGKLKASFASPQAFDDFLKEQDITPQELTRMLAERLMVERFIEKKVGLFVRVTREDAEKYYNGHPEQYKGKRFPDVVKEITALLTDRKVGQELDQYVADLRAKANIRINPL